MSRLFRAAASALSFGCMWSVCIHASAQTIPRPTAQSYTAATRSIPNTRIDAINELQIDQRLGDLERELSSLRDAQARSDGYYNEPWAGSQLVVDGEQVGPEQQKPELKPLPQWEPSPIPNSNPSSIGSSRTTPTFLLTGFAQLDGARFSQSAASRTVLGDIDDGTGFRRARLAATGNLSDRASYMMEYDFAQGQARWVDVWGQMSSTPVGNVRIGRYRQPFGMTELTSIRELPFLERPSVFALSPFRQTGIMLFDTALDCRATWAVSGYRTLSDNFGNVIGDSGGYGVAARATGLLIDDGDSRVFHLGADYAYEDPARNQSQIAYQNEVFVGQNPNLGPSGLSVLPIITSPPFVQSGVFAVDQIQLYNIEAAIGLGRNVIQSEVRWSQISTPSGAAIVPAAYLHWRTMLTGEIIPYDRQSGVFGRVRPLQPVDIRRGQFGAWEFAAQVSSIDLNDLATVPGVPGPGRRMTNYSQALNWYLQTNAKCQLEVIQTDLNDRSFGDSMTYTTAARFQFDF
ncbi:MAG: porin [Pirellulales bacterium]